MELITELVLSIGFPAAIAVYLLIRIEPVLKNMTSAILLLSAYMMECDQIDPEQAMEVYEKLNKP